jgi:pseudouridine-5'-phosphate glycosidase
VPVPEEFEIPLERVDRAVAEAVRTANRDGIRGKALTPFLLDRMKELTDGQTLDANRALLVNNAAISAQIAARLVNLL